jgi:hypothetical protein
MDIEIGRVTARHSTTFASQFVSLHSSSAGRADGIGRRLRFLHVESSIACAQDAGRRVRNRRIRWSRSAVSGQRPAPRCGRRIGQGRRRVNLASVVDGDTRGRRHSHQGLAVQRLQTRKASRSLLRSRQQIACATPLDQNVPTLHYPILRPYCLLAPEGATFLHARISQVRQAPLSVTYSAVDVKLLSATGRI